ncbi:MAG: hypothetical protein U9R29_05790 [Thermodesulfobacteriota bacterium]|nr:hypothetical protein [Thermodesulfobacteriota bacterium]
MTTIRIMSYNLQGCRNLTALCNAIEHAAADFVALQNVTSLPAGQRLSDIAASSGYIVVSSGATGVLALLAKQQVKFIQTYDLGDGAICMNADLCVEEKRFNLLNIILGGGFFKRPEQIRRLLGPDLLDLQNLKFPSLLLGDFYDIIWTSGHYRFNDQMRRFAPPILRGTYPAMLPIFSRDRVYATNSIKLSNINIDHSHNARVATHHLPLILDIEILDNRIALTQHAKEPRTRMEVAPG